MEYHSATNRNKLLIHVTTWMNLKSIKVNERSKIHKAAYYKIHLYDILEETKLEEETRSGVGVGEKFNCKGEQGSVLGGMKMSNILIVVVFK